MNEDKYEKFPFIMTKIIQQYNEGKISKKNFFKELKNILIILREIDDDIYENIYEDFRMSRDDSYLFENIFISKDSKYNN